ncbi:HSP20-like chaperone [Polychytrium aggregatum]|uniref:HSP20-like chaperone n=1 Tax=Polychytrium aggregatum TaxID=110093 RepID=UPI0022FEFBCC|nr:HSP20-like chaperone [Polychytrium aggregatum]KAI9207120.1 HSP20-like chaperone [Polychytrium aggregatum]
MTVSICTRKGCGKSFSESDNHDTACEHHPGAPVFHEGLKGWSCCSKKVTDFDEFMKIPGCTVGRHSTVVEAAPRTPVTPVAPAATLVKDGVEIYGSAAAAAAAPSSAPAVVSTQPVVAKVEINEEELNDAPDAVIEKGAKCKRNGCKFVNEAGGHTDSECVFHSGTPVFHEGSKGWTCCPRKVLEFDEFLKIEGCKRGRHRFTDAKTDGAAEEIVACRHDWYQTQTSVIISVFAKKADKASTKVTFGAEELSVYVKFLDGKVFRWNTPLSQPILSEQSKFEVLSTKVEITLKKANGISWPSIEPTDNLVSWTTFGTTGVHGTVGGKEAHVAADAPVHLFKK